MGAEDAAVFARVYAVTADGNFEGHNILNRLDAQALLSDAEEARLAEMRSKLLARRASRVRPGWDDKILADWNGLMIAALARASVVFEKPDWLALAERAFACIGEKLADRRRQALSRLSRGPRESPRDGYPITRT